MKDVKKNLSKLKEDVFDDIDLDNLDLEEYSTCYIPKDQKKTLESNPEKYGLGTTYETTIVDLEDVIEKNNLNDSENGTFSRRTDVWGKDSNNYRYNEYKVDWLTDPIVVLSNLKIVNGNHRLKAMYNSGYKKAEVFTPISNKLTEDLKKTTKFIYIPTKDKSLSQFYYSDNLEGYLIFWSYYYEDSDSKDSINKDIKYAHFKVSDSLPKELTKDYYAGYVMPDYSVMSIHYVDGQMKEDWSDDRILTEITNNNSKALDIKSNIFNSGDTTEKINNYHSNDSVSESNNNSNLTLYTIQDLSVLKKLKNNEVYVADYNNIFEPGYEDQYKKLAELHGLKNCPIFLADKQSIHIISSSNIKEDNDSVLLTLSIPKNKVHKHNYYDWTDYLYYTTQEEDEEYVEKLEEFIKEENIIDDEDVEYVVDELRPEWLVESSKKLTESLNKITELNESISLDEATRNQLLDKGRKGADYKDQSKGRNRFTRRTRSKISGSVKQYNDIDFDAFFKKDILNVGIEVFGETNNYTVKLKFGGVLNEIMKNIKINNGKLEFKLILSAVMRVFNVGDVYVHCSCPDAKYRQNYWQTKNGYSSLPIETRPSNITNPDDELGSGCKHVLLVLSNLSWIMKVSSTINNYIKYCQNHMGKNYAEYIFPKLYDMKYPDAVQDSMFEDGLLPSDRETIRKANEFGRKSTQFKPGNKEGIRFTKKELDDENEPKQLSMSLEDEIEQELKKEEENNDANQSMNQDNTDLT